MLRQLEKYELVEEIGHGGMATVYRARDTRLDRLVAVKVMHPHLRTAAEARTRFTREAKTVARLKHDNVLEIYDYSGEESPESYIATELLTGPTLKKFAEDHPEIPAEIAACFTIEIARALGAAHKSGVIHRDVKPENVLLHENRIVKLTDFGIAQMVDAQSMTATGQVLGSPGHMAPEQVEGKDCDARSDLFSLGTVLYFLACGRLPFTGKNPHQILRKIMEGDFPDPLRARPSIGGTLRGIILKLLARDPAARYASAEDLERDLRAFLREIDIQDPSVELRRWLRDPEGVSAELRRRVIDALTLSGQRAAEAGQVPLALDRFNRVLALDDGNAKVLALVQQLGRRRRRRGVLTIATGALFTVGFGSLLVALLLPPSGGAHQGPAERDAGALDAPDAQPAAVDSGSLTAVSFDAGTLSDAGFAADLGTFSDAGVFRIRDRLVRMQPVPVLNSDPRTVVLRPSPQSVSIGIDGAEPRPFGPSFRTAVLTPGPHRVRFTGACCIDEELTVQVPAGDGEWVLSHTLRFADARIMVRSNVPADVDVDGRAQGRTWSVLSVPMPRASSETARLSVTSPGHLAYTGTVMLRAGMLEEVRVTLERAP